MLLQDIRQLAQSQHQTKSAIANFLLEHRSDLEKLTMDEIAQASFTSKPSLVRFAQGLGFTGWKEFYPALLKELFYEKSHYSEIDHNLPFRPEDSLEEVIQKIATIEKESIQDTADKLDAQILKEASLKIASAKRIVIFGLSPNGYLAEVFKRKMMAIGKIVEVAYSGEFGLNANSLKKEDTAILISYSGKSQESETLRILPTLKENQVSLIALTSENGDYLRSQVSTCFTICTRENHFQKIGNFSTEESILFILNTLYASYFQQNYWQNYSYKLSTAQELEKNRE